MMLRGAWLYLRNQLCPLGILIGQTERGDMISSAEMDCWRAHEERSIESRSWLEVYSFMSKQVLESNPKMNGKRYLGNALFCPTNKHWKCRF